MAWRHLTEAHWEQICPHLPVAKRSSKGGRPPADARCCFEGILWIVWTGAPWSERPKRYGSPSTCGRRLRAWEPTGVLLTLWRAFLAQLNDDQKLRWNECFVDGSFAPAKQGGTKVGPTKRGKGTKWMVLVDGAGTPLGAYLESASPAAVRLLAATLDTVAVTRSHQPGRPRKRPDRLIADRGYDSKAVRALLVRRGIEPILPARTNNRQAPHQDGRRLRRYRRRWIIERTIGWLGNFRRLTVRYDRLRET